MALALAHAGRAHPSLLAREQANPPQNVIVIVQTKSSSSLVGDASFDGPRRG